MERTNRITIIGGGFSGTALAIQLLRNHQDVPLNIKIIEKGVQLGRGVAYSTDKDFHLLNVRADRMSALPDDPDHFISWLKEKQIPLTASGHMPRKIYGDYLNDLLKTTLVSSYSKNISFEVIWDEATDIELINQRAHIYLRNNHVIESDKVMLAWGNFPPGSLPFTDHYSLLKKYCGDPWNCDYLQQIKSNDSILIIGTGLTMIDTCISLKNVGHQGKIISISRHGYIPVVHNYSNPYPSFYEDLKNKHSILDIFKVIKKHIYTAVSMGIDFRSVIDSLRPYTKDIWIRLPSEEKAIFLKHLHRIWNIVRHRIPPEYQEIIQHLITSHQLEIIRGKLIRLSNRGDHIAVEFKKNHDDGIEKLDVDFVINCTGPQINYHKSDNTLVKNLLAKQIIKTGPFNMGLDANPDGSISSHGHANILYTLGPPLSGILYESTAVPELREQARNLALRVIHDFKNYQEISPVRS